MVCKGLAGRPSRRDGHRRDPVPLPAYDRQGGAAQSLTEAGYQLHAVYTLIQLIEHWAGVGKVSQQQADEVKKFIGIGDCTISPDTKSLIPDNL